MKYEYTLNKTYLKFNFGNLIDGLYTKYQYNGFYISIDKNDNINILSFEPFGIYANMQIESLTALKQFIIYNIDNIEEQYKAEINELLFFIDINLKKENRND